MDIPNRRTESKDTDGTSIPGKMGTGRLWIRTYATGQSIIMRKRIRFDAFDYRGDGRVYVIESVGEYGEYADVKAEFDKLVARTLKARAKVA